MANGLFRGAALDFWRRAVTAEQTHVEADFLERTFAAAPAAQFLDVPCGNGRHALELARRGYRTTGVDLSAEFIAEARAAGSASTSWVQGDMCDLPWSGAFDGACCFGNSFGYLDHEGAAGFWPR
ncbi:MAG: class I SAM-dependent methyltransferase [Bryobacteraceae bacterium]